MFQQLIDNQRLGGIACVIWKDGQVVFRESYGYTNAETREPMAIDTIFRIASMTKPVTSVLAMMLYEAHKLDLEAPVAKWFPQFAQMKVQQDPSGEQEEAHRPITVLDLLTHRAGFTYSEFLTGKPREDYRNALGGDIDTPLTHEQWLDGLASLPLVSQPGEIFHYGRSTDLLGILIAAIEKKPLGQVMQEKICAPLSMTDTFFSVPEDKKDRCAANFGFDAAGKGIVVETVPMQMAFKERPATLAYESGGQGLWSTVDDYVRFAQLFVEGGSSSGVRLLKPETMAMIGSNQLTDFQRAHSTLMGGPMFKHHFGFGLGLAVVLEESPYASMPCMGSVGSVGWPGAYGGWWSADPVNKSIAVFLTHSMADPAQLAQGIGFDVYEAIDTFSTYYRNKVS